MKSRAIRMGTLVMALFCGFLARAQELAPPPLVVDAAAALYPEAKPPLALAYAVDFQMHSLGFKVVNFTVSADGAQIGLVSRVCAIDQNGPAGNVDCLARFAPDGRVLGIANLKNWQAEGKKVDITPLLQVLSGRKIDDLKDSLNVLLNGIAAAAAMGDVQAPAAPPKDFVLNLQQKILEPGAKLPAITFNSLGGRAVNSAQLGGGPLLLVFLGLRSELSADMVKNMELIRTAMPQNPMVKDTAAKMHMLYVVGGEHAQVAQFAKGLGLDANLVVADPTDQVQKLFQVPFKPYCMMYGADGILKFISPHQSEENMLGLAYLLCGGPVEGEPGD